MRYLEKQELPLAIVLIVSDRVLPLTRADVRDWLAVHNSQARSVEACLTARDLRNLFSKGVLHREGLLVAYDRSRPVAEAALRPLSNGSVGIISEIASLPGRIEHVGPLVYEALARARSKHLRHVTIWMTSGDSAIADVLASFTFDLWRIDIVSAGAIPDDDGHNVSERAVHVVPPVDLPPFISASREGSLSVVALVNALRARWIPVVGVRPHLQPDALIVGYLSGRDQRQGRIVFATPHREIWPRGPTLDEISYVLSVLRERGCRSVAIELPADRANVLLLREMGLRVAGNIYQLDFELCHLPGSFRAERERANEST